MNFDVYYPSTDGKGKYWPGTTPNPLSWKEIHNSLSNKIYADVCNEIKQHPEQKNDLKKRLPAVCFTGRSTQKRALASMIPTQLVMCDLDHVEDMNKAIEAFKPLFKEGVSLLLCHVTPSGNGLRFVFTYNPDFGNSLAEQMYGYNELLGKYYFSANYDNAVKDYSRLSFLVPVQYIIYESPLLFNEKFQPQGQLTNPAYVSSENQQATPAPFAQEQKEEKPVKPTETKIEVEVFSEEEKERYENMMYRGTPVKVILEKYLEKYGQPKPGDGEIHNYYNELVKYFRSLVDNNKRALLYLLPRFGHSEEECWSQIKSICKVNTLSSLPKEFYFFLKDNGFYRSREDAREVGNALKEYMLSDNTKNIPDMPPLPPVFRELVRTAPKDFVIPCINALLPILGTLTSYVGAEYPYDGRVHTTSFFSIIWAPPGTGKGFVERFIDLLFRDLMLRDKLQQAREDVYLRIINRKGANDKAPQQPHVSRRLIPPKNSEAEFLEKQKDNHGYHMFTYAAEMDSWAKGVRAAGGNKDDMIRIAWDNGEYGQQFKSANTFKGMVRLYWNVLICGTRQQIESYFKNVENGLVTRCGFASIENQEFQEAQLWKKLSKRDIQFINKFLTRCDSETYKEPCTICEEDWLDVSDEEFDKEIDWQFKFRERKMVDMSWIMPTINAFHKEQIKLASLDIDRARDVFRRRVGVRGFRLALMCTCLWETLTEERRNIIRNFVNWWMHRDLESILDLWGQKYNDQAEVAPSLRQRSVFTELSDTFSRSDMYVVCTKQSIKTPLRNILYGWKKMGYIEQVDKETFKKIIK